MAENEAFSATKQLAEEIMLQAPTGHRLHYWNVQSQADPRYVLDRLSDSPVGELLLQSGEPLGIEDPTGYYADLELYARRQLLSGVALGACAYEISGKGGHHYEVELRLAYENNAQVATQNVYAEAFSEGFEHVPSLGRSVTANEYLETGYEGHHHLQLQAPTTEQALAFIAIARDVFEVKTS